MTTEQKINEFLKLAALEQVSYDEISKRLEVSRKIMTEWERENKKEYKELAEVRKLYLRKEIANLTIREFLKWYSVQVRKCFYCDITESDINKLITQNKITTKRLTTRGRKLEIDRRSPNVKYDQISNLVLCCYWCNNAKTDEFTDEEFKNFIAPGIKQIWKDRINKIEHEK
jgi:5-methylcytosine-specific restriction endonuclease McrA